MAIEIDVVIITKNAQDTLEATLKSLFGLTKNIYIIDDYSKDKTRLIAKKYTDKVYLHHQYNLGKQKAYGISKTKNDWILILDSDEVIPNELKKEILKLNEKNISGYNIPFQNHFLDKAINFGGENYSKLILFNKSNVKVSPTYVHEHIIINKGKIGTLKNKVYHYSYRSIIQIYKKFTDYAIREAKQKYENGEKTSFKKIFLYAPHMFWARFIKDKGYKDGLFRIPLDFGFAYMELVTYILLGIYNVKFFNRLISFFCLNGRARNPPHLPNRKKRYLRY